MSTADDDALIEAARKIADGDEVDWSASPDGSMEGTARWRALRRVGLVAGAWRAAGVHADDESPVRAALFCWGDLEALERLGEGAFGEVFRAWDPSLHREVALKLRRAGTDSALARRSLDEARRLARVRHPNVLTVHGVDVRDERAGLWTDLIRGRTLEQLLDEGGTLGGHEATLIGLDLCRALAAVHAAGLVHGDVKASNVMREDGGRIVLMDFGSVRERASDEVGVPRTGTPLATAPEVLRGQPLSPAADVYSLGALLFRLVTGRFPVTAATLDELRRHHERGERESLRAARPDLPTAFVTAVDRALEPDPARRLADAGALEQALAVSLAPAIGAAPTSTAAAPRAAPRRRALWLVAAALAVAVAIGVMLSRTPSERAPGSESERVATPSPTVAPPAGAGATAPPVAAPAPTAAARAPLIAEATLWRVRDAGREALGSGATISPGDHLNLEWRGAERAWVYVLDEDQNGETYTLFPVAGSDLTNPLPGGKSLRLPGRRDGAPFDWVVTSAGGREDVLIVAAPEPVAALEKQVAAMPPAEPGRPVQYAQVGAEALATLRGIGGMAPGREESGTRLEALAATLTARSGSRFWVRHVVLQSR